MQLCFITGRCGNPLLRCAPYHGGNMAHIIDIAVIGGGASGMAAAITAAGTGASVTLIEAQPRVGRKLLSTGNGRCNLTNSGISSAHYRSDQLERAFGIMDRISFSGVMDFLSSLGLECFEEREGRIYPRSEQATSVLDMLRAELERLGVRIISDSRVTAIKKSGDGFILAAGDQNISARRVILACGSAAAPQLGGCSDGISLAGKLGHKASAFAPALVGLKVDCPHLKALKGVRWRCRLTLLHNDKPVHSENGEIQFNEDNLSGIVTMQMSSRAARSGGKTVLSADLLPEYDLGQLTERITTLSRKLGHLPLESFLSGLLNKRLAVCLLKQAGITGLSRPAAQLKARDIGNLAEVIKDWRFPVSGNCGWKAAQVAAGGLPLGQFDDDLQSKLVPGLYACGEVLDCDGDCGGFNLHWAWCSGITAGRAASKRINN